MKFVNKNYYEILDIDPSASEEDVKRAYRLVRGTWKPDSIAIYSLYTPDESEAIGHKLEEAFQILSNPERRASYDRYLRYANRIPTTVSEPDTFWDIVHGIEIPSSDQDLLEDVTDLLAETPVEAEEAVEEMVREAAGGEARGYDRVVSEDRGGHEVLEALPDRDPAERARTAARGPAYASSGAAHGSAGNGVRHPHTVASSSRALLSQTTRTPPPAREPRPAVPAAPAAPPVKGGAPAWTPPASSRPEPPRAAVPAPRSEAPRATPAPSREAPPPRAAAPTPRPAPASRPEPRDHRDPRETRPAAPVAPRSGQGMRPASSASEANARPPAGEGGWSRSYAQGFKPARPLPDRAISAELLADFEGEHGLGGRYLKTIREYKGITLDDISERTKIQNSYLRYLEEERYSDLPPAVYVEGFVSQVARLLKLDVDRVVSGYMDRYHQPDPREPDEF